MLKKTMFAATLMAATAQPWAADLANGQEINKSCALCHGAHGQGASGKLSPRIAGLPRDYIIKAMKDYVAGNRVYPLMVRTAQLDKFTERDFEDVAAYLASLDLSSDATFNIRSMVGDADAGEEIYSSDCKNCHNRDGYGKPSKEAPPLAGQHPEYLYTSMRGFKERHRIHANDKEDDTFEDYADNDFINLAAYLSTLDDTKILEGYTFNAPQYRTRLARTPSDLSDSIQITEIAQTVVRMALDDGVTVEQAEAAMLAKAEEIELKKVAQQKVSQFLAKQDVQMPHLSIYQFCNPLDARLMVIADPVFSSYMPCRISMVEDANGKLWLMMLNLDMLINSRLLPQEVVETAIKVNQQMLDVMTAGASGKS
ncbi:MAG: c-type cytochrome [Chromatiaceae bacterium]|nr:c-type cytochrome [Gammaproteobacteria bacterium]MCP5305623.1 c-type cytochrome [Chromatiaceae bacterium]MCP5312480.1 c-type cytochrome [Chromatiaceae bacterium]